MRRLINTLCLSLTLAGPLGAQAADTTASSTPPQLFTYRDAILAGAFALGTVAMFPLDKKFAQKLEDSTTQANRFFRDAATGFRWMGSPGAIIIGVSMYTVGRVAHVPRAAQLGLHGTEAIALAGALTDLVKISAGRARPFVVDDTNPRNYKFGRGWRNTDYSSFPSGHTTIGFAAAAAVTAETSHWWPKATWVIAPVMYGGATLIGLSRMYNNKHWASDVMMGAAIGTFAGIKVVRYTYHHPDNRIDRVLLGAHVAYGPDGQRMILWSLSPQ